MKKISVFLLSFFCSSLINAQVTEQWIQSYNGPGNGEDRAVSIVVDNSGNVYVTGWSLGSGTNDDYCTVKYNSAGVELWVQRYNGPADGDDFAKSIAVDNSGNVYVTGSSRISGTIIDYCTIKYNSAGLQQWVGLYSGPGHSDVAYSVAVDNSVNVYVTGKSFDAGTGLDYCTVKYNAGVQQWAQRYNGPGNESDEASSIAVDISGNVYVTGGSKGSGTDYDYCTIKYNSSGLIRFIQRYNGPGNGSDRAVSITVDNSGNAYVTGISEGSGTNLDYCTIKYNTTGVQQWVQRYNGPGSGDDYPSSITVDDSGNVYVTGESMGIGTNYDYYTIKYNSAGVQQWAQQYNGPANNLDVAYSIAVDISGNVYVTGRSIGSGTSLDYCTVKYNPAGVQQWVQRYNGTGNNFDEAISIVVDNSGGIYVTGGSVGIGTDYDYCTIKYYEPIGIQPISNEIPNSYILSQNYPNPFNPTTKIRFEIPRLTFVKLAVFDIFGRETAILLNERVNPGIYDVNWDAGNFSSGIYFYKLITAEYIETRKMVLIK